MTKKQLERRNDYLLLQLKIINQLVIEAVENGDKDELVKALGAIQYYTEPTTVKHNIQFIEEYDERYNFYNVTTHINEYK